nr:MAG TPA: hypothetical protein [Caudoviricetes sp.]
MRDIPEFMESEYFYTKDGEAALKPEAPESMKREFEKVYNLEQDIEEHHPEIDVPYHTWDGRIISRPEFKAVRDRYNAIHAEDPDY